MTVGTVRAKLSCRLFLEPPGEALLVGWFTVTESLNLSRRPCTDRETNIFSRPPTLPTQLTFHDGSTVECPSTRNFTRYSQKS